MPVNAKGRLKYQDFLSKLSTERVPSPPMAAGDSGDSMVAQRGSSAPEVSQGARSTLSSPSRDLRAGLKSQSHPCVSSHPDKYPHVTSSQVCQHRGPSVSPGSLQVTKKLDS